MRQENAHKIKLVKILEILRQDSDEENYIGTTELLAKLAAMGIVCDRRTLAADIDVLNDYGYEVLCEKEPGKPNMYCIVDRSFDVPELRILMDAVQASRFITPKKTQVLNMSKRIMASKCIRHILRRLSVIWGCQCMMLPTQLKN